MLLALVEPPERFAARLAWSAFRRRHQARANRRHAARRACRHPEPADGPPFRPKPGGDLELTDGRWARIAPLLPPQRPPTGRPNHDYRGMHWVARTGSAWRDLPAEFGRWETVHSRYARWRKAGIWQRILDTFDQEVDPATA